MSDGTDPTLKRCPFCAEEIQAAAIFCKHCQRDLKPDQPTSPPTEARGGGLGCGTMAAISLGIFIVMMGLVSLVPSPPPRDPAVTSPAPQSAVTYPLLPAAPTAGDLLDAIVGVGEQCGGVTKVFKQGTTADGQQTFWNAQCKNGKAFMIKAGPSDVKVLDCEIVKLLKMTPCFSPLVR